MSNWKDCSFDLSTSHLVMLQSALLGPITGHRMAGDWESFIYNLAKFAPFVEIKLTMN